ncbi:MAG TPA: glycosyltransferase family protein [Syntrophorhabdaceae bacterium]|nr:glycosyltransferase family protein [Syntrophorhabdaceae bacterium]
MPVKVVATIEARMGSTRFPGKVLERIGEETVLEWTAKRIRMAKLVDAVVVATTTSASDDLITDLCKQIDLPCYRGSEEDVLNRVASAARMMAADIVVQTGADCPFYDPDIIDQMIGILIKGNYHYVCNDMEEGYPVGVNLHVIASETFFDVDRLATSQRDRENVVTYIWEHPEDFRIFNLTPPPELKRPDIRLTVDYREDLALLNELSKGINNDSFRTIDIIRYLEKNPSLLEINKNCKMKQSSCAYNIE